MTEQPERPAFTGLLVYRNLEYRYSFLYPEGWYLADLETEGGQGIIVMPRPDDVATSFSAEARDLGTTVGADDLPALEHGFLAGLRRLPGAVIERHEASVTGALIMLEAWHTFREADSERRRWVRLLYQGSSQARLIAQGATAADFDYWLAMLSQPMRTFQFADWWAEITGQQWLPSLDKPDDEADT